MLVLNVFQGIKLMKSQLIRPSHRNFKLNSVSEKSRILPPDSYHNNHDEARSLSKNHRKKRERLGLLLLSNLLELTLWKQAVPAQIIPDDTLGAEGSIVTPQALRDLIEGGAIRNTNLFHSFTEFNVNEGQNVYFANPEGIVNILARVTGVNPSDILGTLGVDDGSANLILINPNGINFGANASLDVTGSFFATTADSVIFDNGEEFSATNPEAPPLLTVNIPLGLQYGANPGSIVNQSVAQDSNGDTVGLQVQPGQTLALVGGEVEFRGGYAVAPDARIELGGVGSNGLVSLAENDAGYVLGYEGVETFQDINLSQTSRVDTSGDGGGSIQVSGEDITLSDATGVLANTLGSQDGGGIVINASRLVIEDGSALTTNVSGSGKGGNVTVNVSELVQVIGTSEDDASALSAGNRPKPLPDGTFEFSPGDAGDLTINTAQLIIEDGGQVDTATFGVGNGGDLTVNASELVQVIGTSENGQSPSVLSARALQTSTGNAGDLTIHTSQLLIQDGAQVNAGTFGQGDGGNLTVNATDYVQVIGISGDGQFSSVLSTQAFESSTGNAGNLTITTSQLLVQDGAQVSAGTDAIGNGGNLTVNATDFVQLIGTSPDDEFLSILSTQAGPNSTGSAGNLTITTSQLLIQDGAVINAGTSGEGNGGEFIINATDSVQLTDNSLLTVQSNTRSTAGNLKITTNQFTVQENSAISVNAFFGQAGNLEINANNLSLNQSVIRAETGRSSEEGGANITLRISKLLLLDNESLISTDANNQANGGNITIEGGVIVAFPPTGNFGSDIGADAFQGDGGRVHITADAVLGIEFRDNKKTPDNDITVNSAAVSPTITLQKNPAGNLTNLPQTPINAQPIRGCQVTDGQGNASLVDRRRGGLPPNPYGVLSDDGIWVDMQPPNPLAQKHFEQIVEAQGWKINARGNVELTTQTSSDSPQLSCNSNRLLSEFREQSIGNGEQK